MDFVERKMDYRLCPHQCYSSMNNKEKKTAGSQVVRISHFPKILVINLMRFRNNGTKISDTIVNNLEFDLASFSKFPKLKDVDVDLNCNVHEEEKSLQSEDVEILSNQERSNLQISAKYTLQSIIVHTGLMATSGHYYAICRNKYGEYWKYNDAQKPVRISDDQISKIQAYILIYELE